MPGKAVVSISDLHLGRGNEQDSFIDDAVAVERFGIQLAQGVASSGTDLTLLLNGDVFDLWELVSDRELMDGEEGYQAISDGLLVPTDDPPELQRLAAGVRERLSASLRSHPEFCKLLAWVVNAGAKVHVNVGNHDHQFDNVATAAALTRVLADHGVENASTAVSVGRFYLDLDLGFYAEHGDQFAGDASKSPLYDVEGVRVEEAPGFYFLRYVWNRLESKGYGWVQHPNMSEILKLLVRLVLDRRGPVQLFLTYLGDYFRAVREGKAVLIDNWFLRKLYDRWSKKNRAAAFLAEAALAVELTEEDLDAVRDEFETTQPLAALDAGFALEAAETLAPAPSVAPPVPWLPGLDLTPQPATIDPYVRGIRSRFEGAADGFPHLDRSLIHTVTIGHTHDERQLRLFKDEGPLYFNSGSWTKGHRTVYVWSFTDGESKLSGMRHL